MKIVIYKLKVPDGNYCWDYAKGEACPRFDNKDGGVPSCTMNFYSQVETNHGILKAESCASLETIDDIFVL